MASNQEFDPSSAMARNEMDLIQAHVVNMPNCVACRYWAPGEELIRKISRGSPSDDVSFSGGKGTCHRFSPPTVDAFPIVSVEDWCGEWKERENRRMFRS